MMFPPDLMRAPPRTIPLAAAVLAATSACRDKVFSETHHPPARSTAPARAGEGRTSPPPAETRPAEVPPADREPGPLAGITAAHNRVREPLGIAPLTWSPELARFAQTWADKLGREGCDLQHRPRSGPDAQRYGENIYGASGGQPGAGDVVDMWAKEAQGYDAKRGRCKGVCGHYTQIVWAKSQRLGCGRAVCGESEVWVCNYDPPGNVLGQRPY